MDPSDAALANAVDLPDRLRLRATFLAVTAATSACAFAAAEAKRRGAVSGAGKGCALGPKSGWGAARAP